LQVPRDGVHEPTLEAQARWGNGSSATPTGPAGGDLEGTYPNPQVMQVTGNVGGQVPVTSPLAVDTGAGATAVVGAIRLPNATSISARDAAGTGDLTLLSTSGPPNNDVVNVASDAHTATLNLATGVGAGIINIGTNSTPGVAISLGKTGLDTVNVPPLAGVSVSVIGVADATTGTLVRLGAPGTSAFNPTWYAQSDIYWDPAGTSGGNDANSGIVIGSPLRTFAEIVRRYGSNRVQLPFGQSVRIHQLTSQTAGVDPVFMRWLVSGGGYAQLLGTLTVTATGQIPIFTAKNKATNTLAASSLPLTGGATLAAGNYVLNTTRNSYAVVDAAPGGAQANFSQAIPASIVTSVGTVPALVEDNTWAANDTLQVVSRVQTNLKEFSCEVAGDVSAGSQFSGVWTQWVEVLDSSGSGASVLPIAGNGLTAYNGCRFDTRTQAAQSAGRGQFMYFNGCDFAQAASSLAANAGFYACEMRVGFSQFAGLARINGDTIIRGATLIDGGLLSVSDLYTDSIVTLQFGSMQFNSSFWGTGGGINVEPQSACFLTAGSWVGVVTATGALTLGGATTGSAYAAAAFTDGITINPTNLDANNGGLQNPRTGARFCLTT
jgi:hypothetical protein